MCHVWAPAAGPGEGGGGGGGQLRAERAGRVPGTALYCTVLYCTTTFYSSAWFSEMKYHIRVAVSKSVYGPFHR